MSIARRIIKVTSVSANPGRMVNNLPLFDKHVPMPDLGSVQEIVIANGTIVHMQPMKGVSVFATIEVTLVEELLNRTYVSFTGDVRGDTDGRAIIPWYDAANGRPDTPPAFLKSHTDRTDTSKPLILCPGKYSVQLTWIRSHIPTIVSAKKC